MLKKLLLSYYKNTPTSLKEDEVGIVINDTVDVIFDTKTLDINDVRIGYDFKLYLPDADVIDQDKLLTFYNELESFKTDLLSRSNIKSTVIDSLIPIFEDSYTKLRSHLESTSYNYKFVPDTKDPLVKELNRFRRVVYLIEVEIVKANYRYYIDIIKSFSKTLLFKIFFTTKEELISKPEKSLPFYIGDETPEVDTESIHFSTTTLNLYRYNGVKWVLIDNSAISDNYLDLIFSPSTPYSQKTFTETPKDYSKGDIYISSTFIKKAIVSGSSYKESDWTTITIFSEYDDSSFTAKLKELEDKIKSLDLSGAKKLEEKLFQGDYIDPNIIDIDNISSKLKSRWSTDFLDYLTKKELSFILNDFITNRKLGLSTLAYKDKVSKRDLDNTILKDGFIDPALINSSYIEPDLSSLHTKIDDILNISKGYLDHKIMNRLLGLSNLAYTDSVSFDNLDESLKNNNYLNLDLFDIDGLIIKGNFTTQDKLRQSEDRAINDSKNFFKSKILNKELGVSEIAYKEFISFYDLDGTIITGNFIKTELINADAIILNSGRSIRDEISFNTGKTLEDSTNYIQGLITRKELGVSEIAYKQLISFRDLDSTIITGNFIKTELINAKAIVIGGPNGIPTDYIDEKNSQIIQKYSNLNVRVSEAYDLFNELTADATETKDLIFRIVDDSTLTRAEIESLRLRYVELDKNRLSVLSNARIYNDDHSLDEYIVLYNNAYSALNEVLIPILESTEDFVGVDSSRIISLFNDFFNREANLQHAIIREAKEASQSYTDKVRYDLKFDVNKLTNDLVTTKSTLTYLFQDGIVTSEEMAVLRSLLKQLEESHVNLTSRYSSIYNDSAFRDADLKTQLYNSYQNFSNNYSTLINTIQTIIDDKIVTEIESQSFIQKVEDYHMSVQDLADKLDKSLISIINSSVEKAKTDIRAEIGETLSGYVNLVTYNNDISNLQNQLDGAILNYFLNGVPTLDNNPANEWTTEAIRREHIGDIYYDLETNLAYRFIKVEENYTWSLIEDADASLLLGKIKEAKDIADGKRRIFLVQPYPPYDAGDLWITSTVAGQGDLLKCVVPRESGGYQSTDWVLATKYTDDTVASDALSKVQDISADNKLTPVEKRQLLIIYDEIISTHNRILSDIQVFNVPTNDLNYTTYINYYTSNVVPNFTNWVSDINNTTNISPGSIESILNIYFTYRGKIEKLISDVKKQRDTTLDMYLGLTDEVNRAKLQGQSLLVGGYIKTDFIDTDTLLIRGLTGQPTLSEYISSNNFKISSIESTQLSQGDVIAAKNKTTVSATAPVNPTKGDIWIDTSRNNVIKVYGTSWEIYQDNTKTRTFVQPTKPLDPSPASVFSNGDIWIDTSTPRNIIHVYNGNDFIKYDDNQVTADMIRINDIADDNKVTPVEKSNLKKEYDEIITEYQLLITKASQYSISIGTDTTGYKGKYNQLINYLVPVLENLTTTSNIDGNILRLYFKEYLAERVKLDKSITDKVNTLAQDGYNTAKSAESAAQTANTNISYILADEYITPNEKSSLYNEITVIKSEYPEIISRGSSLSINTDSYIASYNALLNFISTHQIFGASGTDISFTTKLVDSSNNSLTPTLRNLFTTYYTEKQKVINSSIGKVDSNAIINLDKLRKFITPDNTLDQLNDQAAQGNTLIKGGKINTTYINTKALLVGDAITWRLYNYSSGYMMYKDPDFKYGFNSVEHRDIVNLGNSSLTRIEVGIGADNKPTNSKYILRFISSGGAFNTGPHYGGFKFENAAKPNDIFVLKIIAKIPVGIVMHVGHGYPGEGGTSGWLTPQEGTGKYQEYLSYVTIGPPNPSIPIGLGPLNYIYFSTNTDPARSDAGPITVDIAYATVFDLNRSENDEINYLYSNIFGISYDEAKTNALGDHTLIQGGMINTNLIEAEFIKTEALKADLITAINNKGTGAIIADRIDSKGLTIKDLDGNVIFGSGKKLDLLNNTENVPSSWVNQNITLQADGTLNGAGGGKVTIGGLGYTGALDANRTYIASDGTIQGVSSGTNTQVSNSNITIQNGRIQGIGSGSGELISINTRGFISHPEGGYYNHGAYIMGRIKIKLPQSWTNTMLRFFVDVFLYNTNKSFTLEVGGYIYENQEWYSCSAKITGDLSHEYPVYFGYADGKCCIWVGESNTVWEFPIIKIRDVSLGYSNQEKEKWETGWNISIDTSELTNNIPTAHNQFSFKISDTLTGAKWAKVGGDGRPEDNATLGATVGKDVKIITTSSGTQTLVQDSFINQWNKMSASNVNTFMQSATIGDAHIINLNAAKVQVGNTSLTVDVNGVSKIRTEHIDAQTLIVNNSLTTVSQSQLYADNAAQQAVDNVQIGGRNYILKSKAVEGYVGYGTKVIDKFGEVMEYSRPEGGGDFQFTFNMSPDSATLKNTEVVFFVIAKDMVGGGDFFYGGWSNTFAKLNSDKNQIDLGDGWKMYWVTFVTDGDGIATTNLFGINSVRGTWRFFAVGVLKGNKPLDWTRAPEDIDSDIQTVRTETQTRFAVLETEISSKVSSEDYNALNQRVGTAESTISQQASQIAQRVTSSTFQQFQIDNNTAISNAKSEAILGTQIIKGNNELKKFLNPKDGILSTNPITGYIVIDTPITITEKMCTINIEGYMYESKSNINLKINFYAYTQSLPFHNISFTNTGNYNIFPIHLAVNINNTVSIILGEATTAWSYPKIYIKDVIIGFTLPPDSWLEGWSINHRVDLTGYNNLIQVPGEINLPVVVNRVTTNETNITQLSNSISLKANQEQVDTLVSTVAGKADNGTVTSLQTRINEAEIKLQPDQINLVVKQQIDTKVDNIQIGGRNYFKNSKTIKKGINETIGGYNQFWRTDITYLDQYLIVGQEYTIAFDVQMQRGDYLTVYDTNNFAGKYFGAKNFYNIGSDKIRLTWTLVVGTGSNGSSHILDFYNADNDDKFTIENITIVKGNKDIPDAISYEDIESDIINLNQRIGSTETSITQLTDSISLKAEKSVVETSINSITTRLNSAEAKITPDAINFTVQSQIDNKVNDVQVGGINYYSHKSTPISGHLVTPVKNTDKGFDVTGNANENGYVHLAYVVRGNGKWTISGYARGSQNFPASYDIGANDLGLKRFYVTNDNSWTYFEHTVDVANYTPDTYDFFRFYNLSWHYFFFKDIVVNKGNKAVRDAINIDDVQADINLRPTTEQLKSEFTISPSGISMLGKTISLAGMVTFSSLDSSAQSIINNKVSTDTFNTYQASVNTQLSSYNTALQDVQSKTNNLTTINGGVIQTGVTLVGNGTTNTAFLSGVIDNGLDSVVIGAGGGGYADKNNVPFRITQRGAMYSYSGIIGGFYIFPDKLSSSITGTGRRTDIMANGDIIKYDNDGIMTSLESSSSGMDEKIYYTKDGNGNAVASVKMGAYGFKTLGSSEQFTPVRILFISSNSKTNVPVANTIASILATHTQLNIQLPGDFTNTISYNNLNNAARYYTPPKDANGNIVVGSHAEGYVLGDNFPDVKIDNGWYLLDGYANFGEQTSYVQKIYYVENGLKLDNVYVNTPVYQATVDVYISLDVDNYGTSNNYQIKYHSVFSDSSYFNEQINCVFNLSGFGGSNDGNKNIIFTEFAHNVTSDVYHDLITTSPMSTSKFVVLQSQDRFLIYANSKYYFVRIHHYQNEI